MVREYLERDIIVAAVMHLRWISESQRFLLPHIEVRNLYAAGNVEVRAHLLLALLQAGYQLVHEVLNGPVECETGERVGLIENNVALRAVGAGLEVSNYTTLTEPVVTFRYGSSVDKVASTHAAGYIGVQLSERDRGMVGSGVLIRKEVCVTI